MPLQVEPKDNSPSKQKTCKCVKNKWKLVPEYFKVGGLAKQHIQSFNYFIDVGIKTIVEHNSVVTSSADPAFFLKYLDIRVGKPELEETIDTSVKTNPFMCRLGDITYCAPIFVDIEYIRSAQRVRHDNVPIGKMPIMLKSSHCVLSGKSEKELMKLKECPLDPGGYFLINGTEKVILIQEQLAYNQVLVDYDSRGDLYAQVRSISDERKTRCSIITKHKKYYLTHNILKDKVPIMVVFRAMGITSDIIVHKMVGYDDAFSGKLSASFEECHQMEVHSRIQALEVLGKNVRGKPAFYGQKRRTAVEEAKDFLNLLLFTHIPHDKTDNFIGKAWFLAVMLRRLMQAEINPDMKDDLDHLSNKRLHLAGNMLSLLFEDAFKRFNQELKSIADKMIPKVKVAAFDIMKHMRQDLITNVLMNAIQTGNWTIRRFRMQRCGVTQVLSRLSFVSALGMMTRVNSHFERSQKLSGPRALHLSTWGMICPCDTPEGEACGLIKNLAFTTHVTTNDDDTTIEEFIHDLGVAHVGLSFASMYKDVENMYTIFINGRIIGITKWWKHVVNSVRNLRRNNIFSPFISIYADHRLRSVFICTDSGRLCRPYIRVRKGKPLITERLIKYLRKGYIEFHHLVQKGIIEFLDANEESDSYIAIKEQEIDGKTTHLEIAPFTTLGVCAGIIPYAHHNQSPRNTYQCAMGKQAMGIFGYNQFQRIDTMMMNLIYPQRPIVKTKPLDCIHFNELPGGQNAIVAVMSYSGYDIEDSIVINKASLERGLGRCQVYHGLSCTIKKYPNRTFDRVMGPVIDQQTNQPIYRHRVLGADGIATVGELVNYGQVLVNKSSPKIISTEIPSQYPSFKDVPVTYKIHDPSYVDRVMLTSSGENNLKIKVLLRQTRTPEVGDKFSSRHGQKGVIGFIAKQEDMPFSEQGIVPDIIMNPHGFPSRMTVGKLIELLSGKAGCMVGKRHDATAFEDCKIENLHQELVSHGYNYEGKDIMYSGITGEPLTSYIYCGPVYYQKLKHMVQDKMHARARGPRMVLTRQPTEGRAREGGLRIGEMERDCLICYGATALINERLMLSSDVVTVDVCNKCGLMGYFKWCNYCKSSTYVSQIKMPYSCKLLFQELIAMNIIPKCKLKSALD